MTWNSLPTDLRNIYDSDLFKTTMQKKKPADYLCRLCKNYLGFLVSLMCHHHTRYFTQNFPYFIFCKKKILPLLIGKFYMKLVKVHFITAHMIYNKSIYLERGYPGVALVYLVSNQVYLHI